MRGRINNAQTLASLFQALFIADFQASRVRALIQSEVDGNPPFDSSRDRANGVGGRTNINFGYLTQSQREIEEPYISLFDGIDQFGITPVTEGTEQEKLEWGEIIAEEITRMIRNEPDFHTNIQLLIHMFTMFGVAFTFRDDKFDWRSKVYDLQYLKLPRRTRATINAVDMVTCKVSMLPAQLYRKIENEEAAIKAGWNPKAVKDAIRTAMQRAPDSTNPQELQESWKDQDYFTGLSATTVEVVHGWVAEVDGTITHLIGRYDGQGEFLYKCEGMYRNMSELITAYTYGVGSNGDFYSIRGNAWNGHNMSVSLNLLTGKFFDQSIFYATPMVQASSEDAIIDQMIQPRGPYNMVVQGTTFPEVPKIDFQGGLIPAIQQAQQIFAMRSRSPGSNLQGGSDRKTAEEIKTQNEIEGRLTTGGINLFFQSWKNDFKEIVKRAINPDYPAGHPGHAEVMEFRKRCIKRGVPEKAIFSVDVGAVEINQGIGKGSAQERRAASNAVMNIINRLDVEGQQVATRSYLAAYTSVPYANLLVPKTTGSRPPMDLQIANMENSLMALGQQAIIEPNQNHVVHVGAHLEALNDINGQLANMQIPMEQAIPQMQPIWEHAGQHMQFVPQDSPLYPTYKEELEQLGEVIINGSKHLAAEQRKLQKEQGQMAEQGGISQGNPEDATFRQAVDAQARIQELDQAAKAQQLDFAQQRHDQEMAQRDARFAQETQQKALDMRLKAASHVQKKPKE